jgi:molecular chaperone GrpE
MSEKLNQEIKPGIYRHYKNKDYQVLHTGINSETKEEMVIYRRIHEEKIYVRPRTIFMEEVEVEGKKVPRFEFLSEVSDEDQENFEDKYKRALADYQNLLKQTAKDKLDFAKYANENLIMEILPVYDNMKTSLVHSSENLDTNGWIDGVKYIIKQFKDVLANLSIEEIEAIGKKFNHLTMEALNNEKTDDESLDDMVAKEIKTGYKLNGKIISPAKVVVYKIK